MRLGCYHVYKTKDNQNCWVFQQCLSAIGATYLAAFIIALSFCIIWQFAVLIWRVCITLVVECKTCGNLVQSKSWAYFAMVWCSSLLKFCAMCHCCCLGRSVTNNTTVSVHWLAWTGNSKLRWRLHRVHWSRAENKGAVWSRRTSHSPLQVKPLSALHAPLPQVIAVNLVCG